MRAPSESAEIECAVGAAPCLTASEDHGFALAEAEITYRCLRPECAAARTASSPSHA